MQAGKHGVIVLNSGRRPSLQPRRRPEAESEDTNDLPESNDPAVIRKIVRRQAALASAGRRKATIAATHQKRSNANRRQTEASVASLASDTISGRRLLSQQHVIGPGALAVTSHRFDPFMTHPVDFEIVRDPNVLHSMFNAFMANVAPLLDLRLPTQDDRRFGRRYSWQKELPQMALSSPPCFWSVMLSASAQVGARTSNDPASSVTTLNFRHMAIRSINKRLDASGEGFHNDFGLLIGIAILGSWEHWWGSSEACKAHADGLQILRPHFQDQDQPHDLLAQIMTFANTFGTPTSETPAGPKYAQELPRIVELQSETNVGFTWIAGRAYLDQRLVKGICSSLEIERMSPSPERAQTIKEVASAIMSFNTKPRLKSVFTESDWARDQDGDRINLEVHIILQAAGVSLMTFLANSAGAAGTADIDVIGMCDEVADLARSVMCLALYDQILLWALVTVFSLNHQTPTKGIAVMRAVTQRLQLHLLPLEAIETYLEAFVFLESARSDYYELLNLVMLPEDRSDTGVEEGGGTSQTCRMQ
ncbi:Putative fungal transcription factor [Septoria linicola]|uniref:Fungal transcription factor n=1 Tax=Septoria linicola TaxID=215465 RepID=A0A9Q9EES7_9PEZI|nr:putative fungal transcription factor [Septoria linicola]USW49111.1 Putative fungal transcription factor [Septoria linicola]